MNLNHLLFTMAALACFNGAQAQVKIGANPSTIGTTSNMEAEATNGKKVIIKKTDGSMVIETTPAGTTSDKYLTVDGSGNVRAIDPPNITPTNVYVFAKQAANQTLPHNSSLAAYVKINLTNEITDTNNAWDAATSTFTAPEDGYYNIQFSYNLEYNCTAIYAPSGGYLAVGLLKTAGTYTGTASTNNGQYATYFQGVDNPTTGSGVIAINPGGGVCSITLYFRTGEQLICNATQANSNAISLSSSSCNPSLIGVAEKNFVSITKM